MPWHIEEIEGEYCVVKDSDGEVEGCHEDEGDAEDQVAALYASEAERVGLLDWIRGVFAPINRFFSQIDRASEGIDPEGIHTIANDQAPKENSMSERLVGLEMAFDQVYAQMWDDEDLSGTWIHDLYLGEGTPFMVVSRQGKLYRVDLTIEGDSVSLGEMQPVEIQFQPTERLATKTVIREVDDGVYRWFSISATSVLNKDGEIDSQALFDSFVDHVEETGEYPVRRFHHVNHEKFVTGECDFVARADHTLITSGVFNDSKLAELEIKARTEEPDEWGESIGYLPTEPPEMIAVSGIEIPTYNQGVLREISTVRKDNACSWFTTTALREEVTRMTLNQRVREGLLDLFEGDEAALDTWLEDVEVTNREIVEQGLISREETSEEGAEEEPEVAPSDELNREVILDDDALDAIVERFSAALDPIRERLVALEEATETHRQEREEEATSVAEALEGLVNRVEELEKPDEEKIEQALNDASPRMSRTRVRYRPRVERGNEEEEDDTPVSEMAAAAEQTLSAIPE